jgi:hypothetical protein
MNTREIAAEYRLSHWAQKMRERQESGLNIREFCQIEGYHENVYYYWQRKLRKAACQELVVKTEKAEVKTNKSLVPAELVADDVRCSPMQPGWLKCEPSEEAVNESKITIEINGCQVLANNDTDTELLKKVCRTLMSLC